MEESGRAEDVENENPSAEAPRPRTHLLKYGIGALLAVAIYAAGLISYPLLFSWRNQPMEQVQAQLAQLQEQLTQLTEAVTPLPRGVERVNVEANPEEDPQLGAADAPITLVEFADYQCPFCKQFYEQTLPQIIMTYIQSGLVRFVYRDFALPFHKNAQRAAEAAECANEQAAFWEMQDHLFKNQAEWADASSADEVFLSYANSLSLDTGRFSDCLASGRYTEEVAKDSQDAVAYGVDATPTFFMDGYKVVGAQPFEVFQWVIETKLKP